MNEALAKHAKMRALGAKGGAATKRNAPAGYYAAIRRVGVLASTPAMRAENEALRRRLAGEDVVT